MLRAVSVDKGVVVNGKKGVGRYETYLLGFQGLADNIEILEIINDVVWSI